ncbi:CheR family methyltransferase [Deinococcus aquiradiocola]|uniref:CheR-type methyltransferase domain-containing protein n=1 Tax=Deinococcus aquiradiocola TaxID=393059 RepID=A0A917PGP7_9DEIO|nr:CheR family methyltransferase [Deinococcus aquiradiocola]GGJ76091.1 hypothetical protein GCM10008939_20330 [Deinococcus aquiradiocola]
MTAAPHPDPAVVGLQRLVEGVSGLRWNPAQLPGALERLSPLLAAHGGLPGLLSTARAQPRVAEQVAAAFTVGETWFMRIREQLLALPDLVPRPSGGVVRAWSAGCSTGEEAYALAAVFQERGVPVEVWGSDLRADAVLSAQRGEYGRWSFRGVDDALRDRHFERCGEAFRARPALRQAARFLVHNLQDPAPMTGLSVVSCRNVTIYLQPEAVQRVYARLVAALVPGGVLLLAPSDPRPDAALGLELVPLPGASAFRRPAARPEVPRMERPVTPARPVPFTPVPAVPAGPPVDAFAEVRRRAYERPEDPDAQLALALALLDAGQPDRAARTLKFVQTLLDRPDLPEWTLARGQAALAAARQRLERP